MEPDPDFASMGLRIFEGYLRMANTMIDRHDGIREIQGTRILVVFKGTYESLGARRDEVVAMPDARTAVVPVYEYRSTDLRRRVDYLRIPLPAETLAGSVYYAARRSGFENIRIWGRTVYFERRN